MPRAERTSSTKRPFKRAARYGLNSCNLCAEIFASQPGGRMAQKMVVGTLLICGALLFFAEITTSQTANTRGNSTDSVLPIAISGHEERLGAAIRDRVKGLEPKTDNLGNVYVTIGKG